MTRSRLVFWLCCASLAGSCALGCTKKRDSPAGPLPAGSSSASPGRLTPELAKKQLAKVGDREITLGEYAATLDRMDPFERLRYQSPERRRQLLSEMIQIELLAEEAKRRGLDKLPETEERLRQILRDELLRDVRRQVPPASEIPEAEVRAYYGEHHDDFREPERRRVAHIVVASEPLAKELLAKAQGAEPAAWGKLVQEHSLDKPPHGAAGPLELAGDLGIVGPPGHPRGANPKVPDALRTAVFAIDRVGGVYPKVVADAGKFHVVRMTGRSEPRDRSYEDASRTIRVLLVQQRIHEREQQLRAELERRYPVQIDDAVLARVAMPAQRDAAAATKSGAP